jgi:hypothetical protein
LKLIENRSIGVAVCGTIGAPPPLLPPRPGMRITDYPSNARKSRHAILHGRSGINKGAIGTRDPIPLAFFSTPEHPPPSPLRLLGSRSKGREISMHEFYDITSRCTSRDLSHLVRMVPATTTCCRSSAARRFARRFDASYRKRGIEIETRYSIAIALATRATRWDTRVPSLDPFSRFHSSTIRASSLNGPDA